MGDLGPVQRIVDEIAADDRQHDVVPHPRALLGGQEDPRDGLVEGDGILPPAHPRRIDDGVDAVERRFQAVAREEIDARRAGQDDDVVAGVARVPSGGRSGAPGSARDRDPHARPAGTSVSAPARGLPYQRVALGLSL